VTWRVLDKLPGYDVGAAQCFERGAYQKHVPLKNTSLIPSHGLDSPAIAPPNSVGKELPTPPHGAIRPNFTPLSTPSHGNHLEEPSPRVKSGHQSAGNTINALPQPKVRLEKRPVTDTACTLNDR
jgi:hypothetical protein